MQDRTGQARATDVLLVNHLDTEQDSAGGTPRRPLYLRALRHFLRQRVVDLQPGHVRLVEDMSRGLAIKRLRNQGPGDVHLTRPPRRREQHRASATRTEASPGSRAGFVPGWLKTVRIEGDALAVKADPGDKGRPMSTPAVRAVAMRNPLRRQCGREADRTAQARTMNDGMGHCDA